MDEAALIDLARTTLITALMIVAPALLIGMTVGLLMSLFQTITSLQEQTLAIVPKIIAVVITLLIMLVFRSPLIGLLSIVPNILPIMIPFGLFTLAGIKLDGPAVMVVTVMFICMK